MEQQVMCCDWKQKYLDLEAKMARMQKEMKSLRDRIKKDSTEVRSHFQHFYQSENSTKIELKELRDKVQMLGNVVIRLEEQFREASDKLVDMQARSMRKNLIISGIPEAKDETAQELHTLVEKFIKEKLQVQTPIPLKIVHRLNYTDNSEYRPTVIKLEHLEHKQVLLSHGPNLQGKKNDKNKHFYLNEQLPDRYAEDRRYAQHWIKKNKAKPVNDQLQMKIYKNKLRVNNTPYHKKVSPPSAAEIIRLDPSELANTRQAPTVYGDSDLVSGSEFISYAVNVKAVEEVRVAYRKLRIKYPDATHIVSAFRLEPPNGPFNQEAADDGEYGGGRCLLSVLEDNDVINTAIFVIRFYGGKHVGPARFDVMRRLSIVALQKINAISSDINPNSGSLNRQAARRQTRSMSIRGRGSSRNSQSIRAPEPTMSAFSAPDAFSPMFRPTPQSSPVVSPTHVLIGSEDFVSASDTNPSHHSQSDYEDTLSNKEQSEDPASHQNSDADDEDDQEG